MEADLTRRTFAALAGTAAGLAFAQGAGRALATETAEPAEAVAEELQADVLVIGGGVSGLAAAVEACDRGLDVVVLEKLDALGGNGPITSGVFGFDTARQRELGIECDLGELVCEEQAICTYREDSLIFKDMALASADNIEWLASHGVPFSGDVDDFVPGYGHHVFHWWGDKTGQTYVDAMSAEAQTLGATVLTATPAVHLVMEGDAVRGAVAQSSDGTLIQVNAKAVILATGGWLNNKEKMRSLGYADDTYLEDSLPGHDGDGLRMAVEAGAPDLSLKACYVEEAHLSDLTWPLPTNDFTQGGYPLWVNQRGERFVNEWCSHEVVAYGSNAVRSQPKAFTVFDQVVAEQAGMAAVEEILAHNDRGDKVKADTLEELAEKLGIDAETLGQTVARYNQLCEDGRDADFGKDPSRLMPVATSPFYGMRLTTDILCSVGGIHTDRDMRAITLLGEPIEGLYAIGVDGCELYRETYTINLPGTANGNNINSARAAVHHIATTLGV